MAGSQQYKNLEIHYVLKAIHLRMPSEWVRMRFEQRFKRKLTENQLRYLKNKYGRDPRFGTPVANSTSPFGTPNPRVGPSYWPTDDILGIDYRSFEERGDDVAEPNLRIVAPINGLVAPNPTPVGSYSPASPMTRPGLDGFELAGVLSAHTTSMTGQKRSHDADDKNQVNGSQASPVQNLRKVSRVQAPAGYENSLIHQSSSPITPIRGNGLVQNSVESFGVVGPVPQSALPIARPPQFQPVGPVQNFNYALSQADLMQPFFHANGNSMGQTSFNMYTGGPMIEQTPQAGISGFNCQSNSTGIAPHIQPNPNVAVNGLVEQNASKGMNLANSNASGAHFDFNGLNQNSSLASPWDFHTGPGMTSMNPLNSTPDFMGLNNTPAVHYGGLGNQGSLGPVSNMAQPVMGYHPCNNNPFTQHPVLYGPTATHFEHYDGAGTYFPQLSGVASRDHAEQRNYTELIGGLDICSAGPTSLDPDSPFHPPAQANPGNQFEAFGGVTTSDDGIFGTDVSGSASTYPSSVSHHSELVKKGKPRN